MSRPHRGQFEAWLRGGQTAGHTFDMTVEVVGRFAIPTVLWLLACLLALNTEHKAEQGAALITAEAYVLRSVGAPLPQKVNVNQPSGKPLVIGVDKVWAEPSIAVPAKSYWHAAIKWLVVWVIGEVAVVIAANQLFWWLGRDKIKARQIRGQEVTRLSLLVAEIEAYNTSKVADEKKKRVDDLVAGGMARKLAEVHAERPFVATKLAGAPYPYETEMQHTMVVGAPGSGKSQAIHQLIDTIRSKGQRGIVFDPELDYIRAHYDPERDVILNPFDVRSPGWSPFDDALDRPDWDRLGHSIFKDPKSGDPYWVDVARSLFSWTGYQLRRRNPNVDLTEALDLLFGPTRQLKDLLEDTPAAKHLSGLEGARVSSLESVLTNGVEPLIYLYGSKRRFSIREWTNRPQEDGGFLFLSAPESHMDSIRPLLGFWSEIAVSAILSRHDMVRHPTWVILDEFHSAGKIEKLADGPQRLRKYGGAVVLGFQQMSQLRDLYGPDKSSTIIGQCQTKLILRAGDFDTGEAMSEQIGRRVMRRVEENTSYGANSIRDGVGLTPKEELEPICLPEDVMNFPSLTGILRVSNARPSKPFPVAPIQIAYVARDSSTPGFIPKPSDPVDEYLDRLRAPRQAGRQSAGVQGAPVGGALQGAGPPAPNEPPQPTSNRLAVNPAQAGLDWGAPLKRAAKAGGGGATVSQATAPSSSGGGLSQTLPADGEEEGDRDPTKEKMARRVDLPTEEAQRLRRREDDEAHSERESLARRHVDDPARQSVWQKEGEYLTEGVPGEAAETWGSATDQEINYALHHRHESLETAVNVFASGLAGANVEFVHEGMGNRRGFSLGRDEAGPTDAAAQDDGEADRPTFADPRTEDMVLPPGPQAQAVDPAADLMISPAARSRRLLLGGVTERESKSDGPDLDRDRELTLDI